MVYGYQQIDAIADNSQLELFTPEELDTCDTRPQPKLKYFPNPSNDNDLLFNLQKEYIEGGRKDDAIFWQMWEITARVARRIIIKVVAKRGLIFAPDEIEDLVSNTCEYLLRRLKFKNRYAITTNYIIAIRDSARHALDYQGGEVEKSTVYLNDLKDIDQDLYIEGEL